MLCGSCSISAVYGKDDFISLKEISARQGITIKYLEQIVLLLSRAGFLLSSRGASGGYRLARPPGGIYRWGNSPGLPRQFGSNCLPGGYAKQMSAQRHLPHSAILDGA